MNKLSVKNLLFKKINERIQKLKVNYLMTTIKGKVIFEINNVLIPFGYEKFEKQTILNLEIHPNKNNEHYNIYAILNSFEEDLKNKNNISSNELLADIEGKGYYPNLRKSKLGYIIRTHVYGNPEIFTIIGNFKNLLTSNDLKHTKANIKMELGTIWINENNYGILWRIKSIEVLYSDV